MRKTNAIISLFLALAITLCGCSTPQEIDTTVDVPGIEQQAGAGYQGEIEQIESKIDDESEHNQETSSGSFDIKSIPEYS